MVSFYECVCGRRHLTWWKSVMPPSCKLTKEHWRRTLFDRAMRDVLGERYDELTEDI
jgi:hypothetical protein